MSSEKQSKNRKRVECPLCGTYTRIVSWRTYKEIFPVGYYCQHCKMLYPKKGIRSGKDKLYQGLRQVN